MRIASGLAILLALGLGTAAETSAGEKEGTDIRLSETRSACVLELTYAVVDDLLPVLRELIEVEDGLALRLAGDWRTNAVIAEGEEAALDVLRALVARLDVPVFLSNARCPARVLDLKRIDADEAAAVLTRLIRAAPDLWRFSRRGPPPSVVAQASDDRLVVQGSDEAVDLLVEVAERLDEAREGGDHGNAVEGAVLLLEYAAVHEIVPILRELYPTDGETRLRFAADRRLNTLHVTAPARLLARFRKTVDHLDVPVCYPDFPYRAAVVELARIDAAQTAALLDRLLGCAPHMWRYAGHGPTPVVVADEAGNRLVVQGDEVTTFRLTELIEELDRAPEPPAEAEPTASPADGG